MRRCGVIFVCALLLAAFVGDAAAQQAKGTGQAVPASPYRRMDSGSIGNPPSQERRASSRGGTCLRSTTETVSVTLRSGGVTGSLRRPNSPIQNSWRGSRQALLRCG